MTLRVRRNGSKNMKKLISLYKEIAEFKSNGGNVCIKSDMLHCDNANIDDITTWGRHYMNNMIVEFVELTGQGGNKFMTIYLKNMSELEYDLLERYLEVKPNMVIRKCSVTPSGKIIKL